MRIARRTKARGGTDESAIHMAFHPGAKQMHASLERKWQRVFGDGVKQRHSREDDDDNNNEPIPRVFGSSKRPAMRDRTTPPPPSDRSADANNFAFATRVSDVLRATPLYEGKINRRLGRTWILKFRGGANAVLRLLGPWLPVRASDDGRFHLRHITRTFNCSTWNASGWAPPSTSPQNFDLNRADIWASPTIDALVAEAISYHADRLLGLGTVPHGRFVSFSLDAFANLFAEHLCTTPEELGRFARRIAPAGAVRAYGWLQEFVPNLHHLKRPPDVRCEIFSKTGEVDFGASFGEHDPKRRVDPASVARSKLLQLIVGLGDKKGANCFGVPAPPGSGFALAAVNVDNEYLPNARMPVANHHAWPNVTTWTATLRPCRFPSTVRTKFVAAADALEADLAQAFVDDDDRARNSPLARALRLAIAAEPELAAADAQARQLGGGEDGSSAIRGRVTAAFERWLGGSRGKCSSWWQGCACCRAKKRAKHIWRAGTWWLDAVVADLVRQFKTCAN